MSVWVPDMSKDMVPSFSMIGQFLDWCTITINIQNAGSPLTQRDLPEDLTPQQHYCGNLKSSLLCSQCYYTLNVNNWPQNFPTLQIYISHTKFQVPMVA